MKRALPEQLGSLVDDKVRTAIEYFAERIAHDFNNIITPLVAYPDILMAMMPDTKCGDMVRAIQESAERALSVTRELAALAGGGMHEVQQFDMSRVAAEAIATVRQQLAGSDQVVIEDILEPNLCIATQTEVFVRAFEALLANAIEAVSGSGGTVSIHAESTRIVDATGIGGERIPDGDYHTLSVTDTGCGISEEDLRHIIEPFVSGFVDKPGCGAGLGLSVAYCGLRRNGAFLQITSTKGEGTRAVMLFPAVEAAQKASSESATLSTKSTSPDPEKPMQAAVASSVQEPPVAQPNEPPSGKDASLRVLVVDDETSITNLFKMILENFIPGLAVDCAHNGAEACEKFKDVRYPVLVMDLHMPVMDGQAAFFEIEKYCEEHGLKMPAVILCTGYAPQAPLRHAIEAQGRHLLLNKPVQSDLLVKVVQERLGCSAAV